jgi:hypothetical protein
MYKAHIPPKKFNEFILPQVPRPKPISLFVSMIGYPFICLWRCASKGSKERQKGVGSRVYLERENLK